MYQIYDVFLNQALHNPIKEHFYVEAGKLKSPTIINKFDPWAYLSSPRFS